MSALSEIDAAFGSRTLAELVRIEPILIACDLLKGLGDLGEGKGARYHRALHFLATLVPRKSTHGKKANLIGHFIEEHVLGIITQFAHVVNDFHIRQPLTEKKRNIIAIGEMIKVARGYVSSALPQALTELVPYLSKHEEFLHRTVLSEQPDPVVAHLVRALLDCCVKFNMSSDVITYSVKEKKDILVLSNFENMEETFDFILFFLQHVLVETFLSASNTRAQGFLAYAMQGLLRFCNLDSAVTQRSRDIQADEKYQRWLELPESVRNTLTPFLTSKYTVTSVFEVLDYLSRWLQGKKKQLNSLKSHAHHGSRFNREASRDLLMDTYSSQIKSVETLLASIPPEVISKRAVECKSFSRALFHWEQYIRQCRNHPNKKVGLDDEPLYQRLQDIYSQIDEPDGVEGISTHLHALNIDQQVLEHRKAGRWATAQNWYELQLEEEPTNSDAQWNLLTCLKESGQQDAILTRFEILKSTPSVSKLLPFAVEASWITGKWGKLHDYLQLCSRQGTGDFNIGIGSAFDTFRHGSRGEFEAIINDLRLTVAKSLTTNSVTSLQSCHDSMLKLHALADVEAMANLKVGQNVTHSEISNILDRRLSVLGGHISDKQYLLGLRRATMELTGSFSDFDVANAWLTSTRLLRKSNFTNQAYQSMLHAARLGDRSATIEHARLLWKDCHHRKAIQILESAIAANEFALDTSCFEDTGPITITSDRGKSQDLLTARAHLLLAKWTDRAGQTQSEVIVQRYREAIKLHPRWEKAHYYLGKHYNKILESEKAKPLGKEAQIYLSGEASKLVIDNYLRSLAHGNKYVFQSLPKVLTLWLEHASAVDQPFDPKRVRIEDKTFKINLARNLGFNHKVAPCGLVVPFQAMLTPTLPASHDSGYLKGFRAFPRDPTTIETVLDDAQVLNSLQKPRKISIRGSDGKIYNTLCKPKDDLRKDQRLMETNPHQYNEIRHFLNEACSDISKLSLFTTQILSKFPPVLHEWFVEMFPESGTWFVARLRYTRSCAIMSMVGYVLGLGDRHGENILFEEGTGGIIHVDFNCLFDKGLTFDKPELVPFRLTQNMVDAFGIYAYNGPFRKTCEISLGLLRHNEDALMTVLETFLHDPTADFIGKKRRTHVGVPDTPAGVLENVRNKLRGLLPGESVPLSVDGHVDELIMEATDKRNLAAMYIGWCAFF
ncbi:protein kinase MEC1 [Aspergillus tanneri]|uniref:non-specific serine/threonine protein kinase n=1 Tax=Aspergillus tanneri TaxID=1220188 RepID=A0A5M9MXF2_9EURO|nr:serine/threonine-protein kinase M1 [Aspergillus tanneri]KAA8650030.1 serine/threonine-protein kinase M1 [Aspergillus tanneri]